MKKFVIALPLAVALAACGSNGGKAGEGGAGPKQQIKVVGSSTVYRRPLVHVRVKDFGGKGHEARRAFIDRLVPTDILSRSACSLTH